MLKQLKLLILPALLVGGLLVPAMATPAAAFNPFGACDTNSDTEVCAARDSTDLGGIIENIVSVLLWIIGAVAVISIIIGGIMFATASGDSSRIQIAKNTVLYAAVGLGVAIVGQAIVLFVVNWII